jgi:hypothetical protein
MRTILTITSTPNPGLIHGLAFRISTLCSLEQDIQARLKASYRHLLHRGYATDKIGSIFYLAIQNARSYDPDVPKPNRDNHSMILFRLQYHPQDPLSNQIQQIWRDELLAPSFGKPLPTIRSHNGQELALIGLSSATDASTTSATSCPSGSCKRHIMLTCVGWGKLGL